MTTTPGAIDRFVAYYNEVTHRGRRRTLVGLRAKAEPTAPMIKINDRRLLKVDRPAR